MDEKEVQEVQKILWEITEKSRQGNYIYRGEQEHYRKISSTLYREYENDINPKHFDIEIAQKEMLEEVRKYKNFTDETGILAELQHYGGKTNLIDFTTNYLIALFFACDGSYKEDGRIILLNKDTKSYQIELPKLSQNNRAISQNSIFVRSKKGYIKKKDVVIKKIPQKWKQVILGYLQKYHGISSRTIYNDLLGYIQNQQKHTTAYAEFYKGLTAYKNREFEEAIKYYTECLKINPQLAEAYNNRGAAKGELRDYQEAIKDYDEAIKINPQDANAYKNRGLANSNIEKYPEAIEDYDKAIEIDPRYDKAYYNRGVSKEKLEDYPGAIKDYDKAIEINPQFAEAYNNRGNVKQELKYYKEAIEDYDKAIEINSQYAGAYYNRGFAKFEIGDRQGAREDEERAKEINPDLPIPQIE